MDRTQSRVPALIGLATLTLSPAVVLFGCGSAAPNAVLSTNKRDLEFERRALVFRQLYGQMKQHYEEDGVLQLPSDKAELAQVLYVHSSLNMEALCFSSDPIELDNRSAMHTPLLWDSSDLGTGGVRVVLFGDGHIEFSAGESAE